MKELKDLIWDTLYDIPRKGPSYLGPREYFNEYGAWMGSMPIGYDFICDADNDCGYIHYWTDVKGDVEYIQMVTLSLYLKLYEDYVYGEGVDAMLKYDMDEVVDGIIDVVYRDVA